MSSVLALGAVAAWRIDLAAVASREQPSFAGSDTSFSSNDHRGSVELVLTSGLDPGAATVVVEQMSADAYAALVAQAGAGELAARVFLWWDDADASAVLAGTPAMVLRVTSLRRRANAWRYEVVIEGRQWGYDRLLRVVSQPEAPGPLAAARKILDGCGVAWAPALPAPKSGTVPTTQRFTSQEKVMAIDALRRLEDAMVAEARGNGDARGGLGMFLFAAGTLRVGPGRLDGVQSLAVDAASGLLAMQQRGWQYEKSGVESDGADRGPQRVSYELTLRGRPDLAPGCAIEVKAPESGGDDVGYALGGKPSLTGGAQVTCYVWEVAHRLTREQGFLTTVHCVAAQDGQPGASLADRLWYDSAAAARTQSVGSAVTQVAQRLRHARYARQRRDADVAQVRAQFVSGDDPPPQTVKLWRGLEAADAGTFAAARLAIATDQPDLLEAAPYATPFAWGNFGMVLPRYPGTRVVLVHRDGNPRDPIDIGAIWERGTGPASQAGDFWLTLPAEIPASQRAQVDDGAAPASPSGKASNDLIDAGGARVISVGKLTIRVGAESMLDAGARPSAADAPVSIEHASGASITIDQQGSITIQAKQTLTLQGQSIILQSSKAQVMIDSDVEIGPPT